MSIRVAACAAEYRTLFDIGDAAIRRVYTAFSTHRDTAMRLPTTFALFLCIGTAAAADPALTAAAPVFDAALAKRTGADERGMRRYVLVILKSGPIRVPDGAARDTMFAGHMANIQRLAKAGKLALAGPFMQDPAGWRGLFVLAVDEIEEAKALVATDPVIIQGEMIAEYHPWYGSAANMLVSEWHDRVVPPAKAAP